MAHSGRFDVKTRGNSQVVNITDRVSAVVEESGIRDGVAVVFVVGSTAAITTTEAEPGLMDHDLKDFFDRIAPDDIEYQHEKTWGDDNGHAHVRASAVGPSVSLPVIDGALPLGTWQQIILIDFDTRGRHREVIVQVVG